MEPTVDKDKETIDPKIKKMPTDRKHILLVEDESSHAELIRRAFGSREDQFQLTIATSLKEVERTAGSSNPDLIITDYRLPDGEGTQLISKEKEAIRIPVVLMTSHGDEQLAVEAIKAGAMDYVVKSGSTFTGMPAIAERVLREWGHIQKQKQAEMAFRESEQRLRTVIDNAPVILWALNPAGEVIFCQGRAISSLGQVPEKIIGRTVYELFAGFPELLMGLERALKGEQITTITKINDLYFESTFAPQVNDPGRTAGVIGVSTDITERKSLENQLFKAQRMEAVGTLAAGVAHDFNNLLMGIQGRASLLLMNADMPSGGFDHLKGIEAHVKSATDLTRQLLGIARAGKYDVKSTNINSLIEKVASMFVRTHKKIELNTNYQQNVWTIDVDQGQLEQVILNLLVNAFQAMPTGGGITIETSNTHLGERFVVPYSIASGNYVCISITDTGMGMDDSVMKKIFDPFFTTKEKKRGTGLGLASAYGIVKNHKGMIQVKSIKSQGTTFDIYLPASQGEVQVEREKKSNIRKGKETILVVDDEEMILDVACEMLRIMGYETVKADNGSQAIDTFQQHRDGIDLVLLDLVMPKVGGGEVFDAIRQIKPDQKVILCSGYSLDGEATRILNRGCNSFIQKPFKLEELSAKIEELFEN